MFVNTGVEEWYESKLKYPSGKIDDHLDEVYKVCCQQTSNVIEYTGTLVTALLGYYIAQVASNKDATVEDKIQLLNYFKQDLIHGPTVLVDMQLEELERARKVTIEQKV